TFTSGRYPRSSLSSQSLAWGLIDPPGRHTGTQNIMGVAGNDVAEKKIQQIDTISILDKLELERQEKERQALELKVNGELLLLESNVRPLMYRKKNPHFSGL
ncbi:hypothetical protein GCK32_002290, partial [Trichostrongylus colubriformis]